MDSSEGVEFVTPSTSFKCFDSGCTCCSPTINRSFSGSMLRSVKRKLDDFEEEKSRFLIPGLVLPQNARVEIENECVALREMVTSQQQSIQDLTTELEEERNAASSAANEAMSMILRLQSEKAEIQMELRQFKRFTEEKMAHDQQELLSMEDLLYKREQAIQSLTCEVEMYKHRMMSFGITEAEADGEKIGNSSVSQANSVADNLERLSEVPSYDYPPIKCNLNENQAYSEVENEAVDVEKFAFGETPHHLKDLEFRINQLERSPKNNQPHAEFFVSKNVLEKVVVGYSPRRNRHIRKFSSDSTNSFPVNGRDMGPDFAVDSPKFGGSFRKADFFHPEEVSNFKKVDNVSDVGDDMSDRVYTIDSVYTGATHYSGEREPKASVAVRDDYMVTPKGSATNTNSGDPEIQKLYTRLQALEADRESMRQALISMRTDKAQLVLLKEIAQNLCKDVSPMRRPPVSKPSLIGSLSFISIVKWIVSFVFWRKKAHQCRWEVPSIGLVRCPKCENLLPQFPGFSVYQCSPVLRDTQSLNDYWRLSEGMKNLQLKSVVLFEEMSNVKASLNDPEASISQRALQCLLANVKLTEPILDGFTSSLPPLL